MICGAVGKMEHREGLCVGVASQKGTFVQDLGAGDSGTGRESGDQAGGPSVLNPGPVPKTVWIGACSALMPWLWDCPEGCCSQESRRLELLHPGEPTAHLS